MRNFKDLKIAVAGTGYVGLSLATLLAQHHQVIAVDVVSEKVEKINRRISPIQDEYIEKYLSEKTLNLTAPSPWEHRNSAGRRIIWRSFAGDRLTATTRPWMLCSRQKRKAPVARTQRPGPNVKTPVL